MKILLTGGSGLLGQELQKYLKVYAPSSKQLDINNIKAIKHYDLIIHSAAYTDVVKAETETEKCYFTNVVGSANLVNHYLTTPFVYISSEYANNPQNVYSRTKLMAEIYIQIFHQRHLIIRTLFKPNPFPWDKAFTDQYTQGDYLDIIAPMIARAIETWDKKTSKTVYVGTGRKTMYDLAKRTRPNILPMSVKEITSVNIPSDYK